MISVIDMPGPDESIWWRGKRGFEVGFFPCECVEVIGDKVCSFCNCNFCQQLSSYLFERLLLLKKLISLLLQVPHGLNLPHSSATLPHLARYEKQTSMTCTLYNVLLPCICKLICPSNITAELKGMSKTFERYFL